MPKHDAHCPLGTDVTPLAPRVGEVDALLLSLVREALDLPSATSKALPKKMDWPSLLDQMWTHRLGSLVWPCLSRHIGDLPPSANQWIRHFRDVTTQVNGANLLTMRRIIPCFHNDGIRCLAYKGPVLQQIAYGNVFMRPSSDLDILVHPADFNRAGELIASLDYKLAEVCRSLWWKAGLGEQHFRSDSAARVTIDLHHRVQQPGCPLPRRPERFMTSAMVIDLAGQKVPTLSYSHSILLSAISFVKALHHREPAARYVVDMVALGKELSIKQWLEVESEARIQGLRNTLSLTVRAAKLLFGFDSPLCRTDIPILSRTADATLVQMTLRPSDPSIQWPRRRDLLHALCDNKLAYPANLAAMVGSDLLRQAAEGKEDRQHAALLVA